jgi:hypothetical protein
VTLGNPEKKEAKSKGFGSDSGYRQRNNEEKGTFYNLRVIFSCLLFANIAENWPTH